jgi:polar amino acid transport system substrate-binding protein
MFIRLTLFTFMLCIIGKTSEANATGAKKISDKTKEIVFVTSHYPPYVHVDGKGNISGVFPKLLESYLNGTGYTVKYWVAPWQRCEKFLKEGKAFGAFPYLKTKSRSRSFNFTKEIVDYAPSFMFRKENFPNGFKWDNLDDLKPYKLGAVKGFWYVDDFKAHGLSFIEVTNDEQNIKMLSSGRIDATLIEARVADYILKDHGVHDTEKFGFSDRPYGKESFRVMVSRSYPDSDGILKFINERIKSAQKENAKK